MLFLPRPLKGLLVSVLEGEMKSSKPGGEVLLENLTVME